MSEQKNRRAFQRLPASSSVEMWTANQRWQGKLSNQSLGGIGLVISSNIDRLTIGEEVRVKYDDTEAVGFVRYIRLEKDGSAFMGIAWDQRETPRKDRKREAVFFINGPLEVVCRACAFHDDEESATFKLWDGAEFTEDAGHVIKRDESQREAMLLADLEELQTLLKLYQLGETDDTESAIERVIDFEFTR